MSLILLASSTASSVCANLAGTACTSGTGGLYSLFKTIANVLIYIIGGTSVIMVVIGGLRFTLSAGNPAATKAGRETIIYALVGVVLSITAYSMVNFVFGHL